MLNRSDTNIKRDRKWKLGRMRPPLTPPCPSSAQKPRGLRAYGSEEGPRDQEEEAVGASVTCLQGPREGGSLSPIPALLTDGLHGSPILPEDSGVPESTTPPLPSTLASSVVSPPSPLARPTVASAEQERAAAVSATCWVFLIFTSVNLVS